MKAYSLMEVKAATEEGIITGVASTPTPDRSGDVMNPRGARFKLPIPLLWQHRADSPIGHVTHATVSDKGIEVIARIARGVTDEIDRAYKLIRAGLCRGLSVGFRGIEGTPIGRGGATNWNKWELVELSCVTLAMNAEASITNVKRQDQNDRIEQLNRLIQRPLPTNDRGAQRAHDERIAAFRRLEHDIPRTLHERASIDEFHRLAAGPTHGSHIPVLGGDVVHIRPAPIVEGPPARIGNPDPVRIPRRR